MTQEGDWLWERQPGEGTAAYVCRVLREAHQTAIDQERAMALVHAVRPRTPQVEAEERKQMVAARKIAQSVVGGRWRHRRRRKDLAVELFEKARVTPRFWGLEPIDLTEHPDA